MYCTVLLKCKAIRKQKNGNKSVKKYILLIQDYYYANHFKVYYMIISLEVKNGIFFSSVNMVLEENFNTVVSKACIVYCTLQYTVPGPIPQTWGFRGHLLVILSRFDKKVFLSKPGSINSRLVRVQVWTKVVKKQVLYTVQCTLYIMGLANAIFLILEEFRGRTLAENNQSIEAFLAKLSHKVLLII